MSKITEITLHNTRTHIRPAIQEALDKLSDELGLTITLDRITIDREGRFLSGKIDAVLKEEGKTLSLRDLKYLEKCEMEFRFSHQRMGIHPKALGASFLYNGNRFVVKGLSMGRVKEKLAVQKVDGSFSEFDLSTEQFLIAMNKLQWTGLPDGEPFYTPVPSRLTITHQGH